MSKSKSKKAVAKEEKNVEVATFTFPCKYCGGQNFSIREYGGYGICTAVCCTCQGTEEVGFLDV